MSWDAAFRSALGSKTLQADWVLRKVWSPDVPGKWLPEDILCSRSGLGGTPCIIAPPRVGGSRLAPLTWTCTYGAWEITVLPSVAGVIIQRLPRGSMCQLLMGLQGMARDEFQPVALGRVQTIRVGPQAIVIRFWDIATGLSARLTDTYAATYLFQDVDTATTISSDYTAGDNHIHVTADVFGRESGGTGLVKITPSSGSDPFYITYTGLAALQLTGVPAAGVRGSTAVDAAAGSVIANVGYVAGHPFDVARKILTSGGNSGAWDLLPDYWGLALPGEFLDDDDIDHWKSRVDATGGTSWELAAEAEVDGGWGWLAAFLAQAGIWIVQRMGVLSLRAALDPETYPSYQDTISDSDLVEGNAWSIEAWDQQVSAEVGVVDIISASSHTPFYSDHLETSPGQALASYDLSGAIFGNEANQRSEVGARLKKWGFRPAEALALRCVGWRLADLCPGDAVLLDLKNVRGRLTQSARTYTSWPAIVYEVAPDFSRCETAIGVWPIRESYL